jgi:hypothetical protein
VDIVVEGWRAGASDWEAVRNVPVEQLPPLSAEQREVACKLGIREEDYARSALAGQRTAQRLLEKTERLGRLLQQKMTARGGAVTVQRVALQTWEHRFNVQVEVDGQVVSFRVAEEVVDDLFEGGSADADQRLSRILEVSLPTRVA